MNLSKSKVFELANQLHWQQGLSKSEALTKAWKVIKLKRQMRTERVQFTYRKKDGSIRKAAGTTSTKFFSYDRKTERKPCPTLVTYFDLEKNGFRRFKASEILELKAS